MKITILGSGSSKGIPQAGNYWGEADPKEPKNNRMRTSLLFSFDNHNFLIDAGPDFRFQMNKFDISKVDSVLFTHGHNDHIDGLPDLLWMAKDQNKDISFYASKETYETIMDRFSFLFNPNSKHPIRMSWNIFEKNAKIMVHTKEFQTFQAIHRNVETTALKYNNFCCVSDFNLLDDEVYTYLQGLECLIINANDGFEINPTSSHANFYKIFELDEKINAKNIILNHLKFLVDHNRDEKRLPPNFKIAYDGMVIKI